MLAAAMMGGTVALPVMPAVSVMAEETTAESSTWKIDGSTLTIPDDAALADFMTKATPDQKKSVWCVIIGDKVTTIPANAFSDMIGDWDGEFGYGLKIYVPKTVQTVEKGFIGDEHASVYYQGNPLSIFSKEMIPEHDRLIYNADGMEESDIETISNWDCGVEAWLSQEEPSTIKYDSPDYDAELDEKYIDLCIFFEGGVSNDETTFLFGDGEFVPTSTDNDGSGDNGGSSDNGGSGDNGESTDDGKTEISGWEISDKTLTIKDDAGLDNFMKNATDEQKNAVSDIQIADGVTKLPKGVFDGMQGPEDYVTITIPASVKTIENGFIGVSNTKVFYAGNPKETGIQIEKDAMKYATDGFYYIADGMTAEEIDAFNRSSGGIWVWEDGSEDSHAFPCMSTVTPKEGAIDGVTYIDQLDEGFQELLFGKVIYETPEEPDNPGTDPDDNNNGGSTDNGGTQIGDKTDKSGGTVSTGNGGGGVVTPPAVPGPAIGTQVTYKKIVYQVTSPTSVKAVKNQNKKKATKVSLPSAVTVNGKSLAVTEIGKNAFKSNKKLKTVTIPASVTKIGENAFKGCKSLKKINVKTKKLNSTSIKNLAKSVKFRGTKLTVKVPKAKKKAYKKTFKKSAKKVKIK